MTSKGMTCLYTSAERTMAISTTCKTRCLTGEKFTSRENKILKNNYKSNFIICSTNLCIQYFPRHIWKSKQQSNTYYITFRVIKAFIIRHRCVDAPHQYNFDEMHSCYSGFYSIVNDRGVQFRVQGLHPTMRSISPPDTTLQRPPATTQRVMTKSSSDTDYNIQ